MSQTVKPFEKVRGLHMPAPLSTPLHSSRAVERQPFPSATTGGPARYRLHPDVLCEFSQTACEITPFPLPPFLSVFLSLVFSLTPLSGFYLLHKPGRSNLLPFVCAVCTQTCLSPKHMNSLSLLIFSHCNPCMCD